MDDSKDTGVTQEGVDTPKQEEVVQERPFSDEQIDAWKRTYGDRINLVADIGKETYVVRGLGRKEFVELSNSDHKHAQDIEDHFVSKALLYPATSEMKMRESSAGVNPHLFTSIIEASGVRPRTAEPLVPKLFPFHDLQNGLSTSELELLASSDIKEEDVGHWVGKYAKVYYVVLDGQLFIYKGVLRKDYTAHQDGVRNGDHEGTVSEEVLVESSLIYPFRFTAGSDDNLHGTITTLHELVLSASSFSDTPVVTKL